MARGWESKSVAAQMEDARGTQPDSGERELTEGEKNRKRERDNLILARAGILHQLESSTNERYTEFLRQTLIDLDRKIGAS